MSYVQPRHVATKAGKFVDKACGFSVSEMQLDLVAEAAGVLKNPHADESNERLCGARERHPTLARRRCLFSQRRMVSDTA